MVKYAERYFEARGIRDQKCRPSDRSKEVKCHTCGKLGHISPKCPTKKDTPSKNHPKPSTSWKGKQTGGSCIAGVCTETENHESKADKADAIQTVKLMCGHELLVLNSGYDELGSDMPTCEGEVNGKIVTVLRDSGCNAVIVRTDLVLESQMTGEYQLCLLIDRTVRRIPTAFIELPLCQSALYG